MSTGKSRSRSGTGRRCALRQTDITNGMPGFDVLLVDDTQETEIGTLHFERLADGTSQWVYEPHHEWPPGVSQWSVHKTWQDVCRRLGLEVDDPSRRSAQG